MAPTKILSFSVNAIYTEAYNLQCCFKHSKHILHFILKYAKTSFMVHGRRSNFLSINFVKIHILSKLVD